MKNELYKNYEKEENIDLNNFYKLPYESESQKNNNYIYSIESYDSEIRILKYYSYGLIKEKIKFKLTNGRYNNTIRKISLEGTNDKIHSFKIGSRYIDKKFILLY